MGNLSHKSIDAFASLIDTFPNVNRRALSLIRPPRPHALPQTRSHWRMTLADVERSTLGGLRGQYQAHQGSVCRLSEKSLSPPNQSLLLLKTRLLYWVCQIWYLCVHENLVL